MVTGASPNFVGRLSSLRFELLIEVLECHAPGGLSWLPPPQLEQMQNYCA